MLAIVDYDMGNIKSIVNAFSLLGEKVIVTDDPQELSKASAIILPGVGAFSDAINNLQKKNLIPFLEKEILEIKKPYLGICLGLELLAKKSFEGGIHNGLGWINGTVEKVEPNPNTLKVPHMGWDDTSVQKAGGLLKDLENPIFYYLHSYYMKVDESEKKYVTSTCDYGGVSIVATFQRDNIYAVQFHPEKSQSTGIKLLQNFLYDVKK